MRQVAIDIERGQGIAQVFMRQEVFQGVIQQMIAGGEKAGDMTEPLLSAATYFESLWIQKLDAMIALLHPALTAIMGLLISGMLIAAFPPSSKSPALQFLNKHYALAEKFHSIRHFSLRFWLNPLFFLLFDALHCAACVVAAMAQSKSKLAILHDDSSVGARVAGFAAAETLSVAHVPTVAALEGLLNDPSLAAVVIDLVGPNSGGFELLEKIARAPARPQVIVVTSLDSKTVDSTRRLAKAKDLKIKVFRKDDDAALKACLAEVPAERREFDARDLEYTLDHDLLVLEYQPKVPLIPNAAVYGVEALCRASHPDFGKIYPDQFIALAEKEGLIGRLTDTVARMAFRDWCVWRKNGLILQLALNVSPELLNTVDWCETFMQRCGEFDVDPAFITLEVTESSQVTSHAVALDVLTRLRLKGFTLSIDDFGTGFSSLATLYKLPFSELKIDKGFTFDLQDSQEARALVDSTIGMARRLGIKVCAEGVESEADFLVLRRMGCGFAQGYFIAKSMPPDKIPDFFAQWRAPLTEEDSLDNTTEAQPKIAMIQSLLKEILTDEKIESDRTIIFNKSAVPPAGADLDSTLMLARKIPALALRQHIPAALAQCHIVLDRAEQGPARKWMPKIRELQRALETELLCKNDVELLHRGRPVRLLSRQSLLIGRASQAHPADVPIACRWLSRGDKNLRLFSDQNGWFVEDLGSTNGSFLGDKRLERRHPVALALGDTLIEIGKKPDVPSPVAFRFHRPSLNPDAVVMTLVANTEGFGEAGAREWPSWQEDVQGRWIFFHNRIAIGKSADCALVLEDCTAAIGAEIGFESGFWIVPVSGAPMTVSGVASQWNMPLPVPSDISIGGALVSFRPLEQMARASSQEFPVQRRTEAR